MTHACPCEHCDRPAPGTATICGACSAEVERALHQVPALARDLDTTLARQTGRTASSGRPRETPLPYSARASEAGYVLRSTLVGWVRALHAHAGGGLSTPADTLPAMAGWLTARASRLAAHPAAEEAHAEITAAVQAAQRAVDRPADLEFAGRCPGCDTALYARPGAAAVQCRDCDHEPIDIDDQYDQMRAHVEDQLAHPTAAAKLLARLEVKAPESTIRRWAKQGRILDRGTDPRGRRLYRIGDILDTITREARAG